MKKCKFYSRDCNHCGQCMFCCEVNGQINYKLNHSAYKRAQKKKAKKDNKEKEL